MCIRDRDSLPKLIETLETKLQELNKQASASDFYKKDQDLVGKTLAELQQTEERLEAVYLRWDELEAM